MTQSIHTEKKPLENVSLSTKDATFYAFGVILPDFNICSYLKDGYYLGYIPRQNITRQILMTN